MTLNVSEFKKLSAEVDAGHLRLESGVADQCVAACDEFIEGVLTLLPSTVNMLHVEAFGTLRSGQQLGQKFFELSNGGPGSLQDVLKQHVQVVKDMREVFFKAGAAYHVMEGDNQRAILAAGATDGI